MITLGDTVTVNDLGDPMLINRTGKVIHVQPGGLRGWVALDDNPKKDFRPWLHNDTQEEHEVICPAEWTTQQTGFSCYITNQKFIYIKYWICAPDIFTGIVVLLFTYHDGGSCRNINPTIKNAEFIGEYPDLDAADKAIEASINEVKS